MSIKTKMTNVLKGEMEDDDATIYKTNEVEIELSVDSVEGSEAAASSPRALPLLCSSLLASSQIGVSQRRSTRSRKYTDATPF